MTLQTAPCRRREGLPTGRMLFVRTGAIPEMMVNVPLLIASAIIVAAVVPIQPSFSFGAARNLDLAVYPDGTVHVSTLIDTDPLDPDLELDLYGTAVDNFVAVGQDGFLLRAEITGGTALVETFGSSEISAEYDIHDLVSKTGRVWTFSLDSPVDFTLLLPENSAIVSMTNLPINMGIVGDQNQLTLPAGDTEVDYLFSTHADPAVPQDPENPDYAVYGIVGGVAAAVAAATAAAVLVAARAKQKPPRREEPQVVPSSTSSPPPAVAAAVPVAAPLPSAPAKPEPPDAESILRARQDIRDDDKEIVRFISENGGQALESELRKKFLQPRTTMWRAVKRLERNEIIEIEKKDMQNLVKLRMGAGDESG